MPVGSDVVVKVTNLKKYFELTKGVFSFAEPVYVKAVDDVNFEIHEGEILGLVGESGCGKTTTGRLLTRLEDPTGGSVFFQGRDVALLQAYNLKVFRRNIQMVFQDPYESLNPRTTVLQTIMEPLINHNIGETYEERVELAAKALEDAGLAPAKEYLNRFPHELSGGQRQRVSIARALVINPKVIVADEPVSMLDVSIRAGVLNLMLDLRDKYNIPYLFITHDIAVARYVSDRLAVMYLGRVVELAETDKVIFEPKHPYTRALLSAVPVPDPEHKHGRIQISGEIPSATNVPLGCRFRPRCPFSFVECGWEGKDLAAWLLEQKVADPAHPMNAHIGEIEPNGFSLIIKIKDGGDPAKVISFLESKVAELQEKVPMFKAIFALNHMGTDKELVLRTKAVSVPGEYVAKELLEKLNETVDYKSRGHPLYGTIMDAKVSGSTLALTIGPESAHLAEGEPTKVETTVGFVKDFVKGLVRSGFSEFKGASSVTGAEGKVVVTCRQAKLTPKRVAQEAAEIISEEMIMDPRSGFHNLILAPKVTRSSVEIRLCTGGKKWEEFAGESKDLFERKAREGHMASKGVAPAVEKAVKGAKQAVVVSFFHVAEPPLTDVGGGHQVACYLFKGQAQ
ncbi:MAG: ATP-binding cassette domain-containing protein [Thermoplasmata archaeon]|nr:ATP-binding cassette domain-containing protein [Thermoplasmata archaeon]